MSRLLLTPPFGIRHSTLLLCHSMQLWDVTDDNTKSIYRG